VLHTKRQQRQRSDWSSWLWGLQFVARAGQGQPAQQHDNSKNTAIRWQTTMNILKLKDLGFLRFFFAQQQPIVSQEAPEKPVPPAVCDHCINKADAFSSAQLRELRAHGFNI
jgi:hypothetical protein